MCRCTVCNVLLEYTTDLKNEMCPKCARIIKMAIKDKYPQMVLRTYQFEGVQSGLTGVVSVDG